MTTTDDPRPGAAWKAQRADRITSFAGQAINGLLAAAEIHRDPGLRLPWEPEALSHWAIRYATALETRLAEHLDKTESQAATEDPAPNLWSQDTADTVLEDLDNLRRYWGLKGPVHPRAKVAMVAYQHLIAYIQTERNNG